MNRQTRRYKRHEIRRLAARSDDLRARLAVSEAEVSAAERGRADIVAGVHARIEEFVDSLAQLPRAPRVSGVPAGEQVRRALAAATRQRKATL